MKDKVPFTRKIGDFLAGKGFYIVLFICTAVIGLSAWALLSTGDIPETSDPGSLSATPDFEWEVIAPTAGEHIGAAAPSQSPSPPAASEKPEPSSEPVSPSPSPDKKGTSGGEGGAEEVMAREPVFTWPLTGEISAMYSVDELMYSKTMGDWRTHDGIDIAGTLGAKVVAVTDGTVAEVRDDDLLGTTVVIDHGDGLCSVYANLARTPVVVEGDKVAMGAVIGAVGNTALGEADEATHLHFAMTQDGAPTDPIKYLPKR